MFPEERAQGAEHILHRGVFARGQTIEETAWSLQTYDISAYADRQSAAKIRWGIGPTDAANRYCGWNLDDIEILGAPLPTVNAGDLGLIKSTSADGDSCLVRGKVVTASFSDCFYIQEPGKYQGLKVVWPYGGIFPNRFILVHGQMQTDSVCGERCLVADYIYKDTATPGVIQPVGMQLLSLGGSTFGLQGGVSNGRWVHVPGQSDIFECVPAAGLNNIGCLVRVSGKVTKVGSDYFYVDDGSGHSKLFPGGLLDGTSLQNVGVRVQGSLSASDVGKQAVVTGISTGFVQDGGFMRMIRPIEAYLIIP